MKMIALTGKILYYSKSIALLLSCGIMLKIAAEYRAFE
jgi:hypothetical protein